MVARKHASNRMLNWLDRVVEFKDIRLYLLLEPFMGALMKAGAEGQAGAFTSAERVKVVPHEDSDHFSIRTLARLRDPLDRLSKAVLVTATRVVMDVTDRYHDQLLVTSQGHFCMGDNHEGSLSRLAWESNLVSL